MRHSVPDTRYQVSVHDNGAVSQHRTVTDSYAASDRQTYQTVRYWQLLER